MADPCTEVRSGKPLDPTRDAFANLQRQHLSRICRWYKLPTIQKQDPYRCDGHRYDSDDDDDQSAGGRRLFRKICGIDDVYRWNFLGFLDARQFVLLVEKLVHSLLDLHSSIQVGPLYTQ